MNENGEMFASMCFLNSLIISGSIFPRKRIHKVTWIYMKKKISTVSFRKKFGLFRDLNQGPNDSEASSIPTELYSTLDLARWKESN